MERQIEDMKQKNPVYKIWDLAFFVVLFGGAVAVTFQLFSNQCAAAVSATGSFPSDMKAYILEMQGLDSGYSFPYPVLFRLGAFFHLFTEPAMAMALATTVLNALSMVVMKLALNRLVLVELTNGLKGRKWLAGSIVSVVAISLFFVSMIFTSPLQIYLPGIYYNYLGVFTANPFHNATYMAARPFAILAFLWFVKLLDYYEQVGATKGTVVSKESTDCPQIWVDYVLFSLFLLLSTMAKPSFTIVLVGAAGLIMVYRMIRSKFQNFKPTILLGLTFIPTFIDLLYQYKGVFVPDEGVEGGIGFCFGDIWGKYCGNIPFAIGLAIGFPILVLILNYKEIKTNTLFRFSWQVYLMGFAMAFLIYEKGFRAPDFNFSWGYMYGIFFAFVGAVVVLLRATAKRERPLLLSLQWAAFAAHLLCGLYYFYGFCVGRMYY